MTVAPLNALTFRRVPQRRLRDSLATLYGDLAAEDREEQVEHAVGLCAKQASVFDSLFEACRDNLVLAVAWARIGASRRGAAEVRLSPADEPAAVVARRGLLDFLSNDLQTRGIAEAHVLLRLDDAATRDLFIAAGYRETACLLSVVCGGAAMEESEESDEDARGDGRSTSLEFETWHSVAHDRQRLIDLIAATFAESLDLPRWQAAGETAEHLARRLVAEACAAVEWRIARRQDRDMGCLGVVDHGQHVGCEIQYLGLVPSERGRGWGLALLDRAKQFAWRQARDRLFATVDADNVPARKIYARAGFVELDPRRLMTRRFSTPDSFRLAGNELRRDGEQEPPRASDC